MAKGDIELLEEAFERLDSERFESMLPLVDERFEMTTTSEVASEPDTYRGHDGVRRWFASFLEAMEWVRLEPQRFHPAGAGRVIVEFEIRARGRRSGIETEQSGIALATLGGEKLRRLELFSSLEQARAAARSRSR